MLKTRIMLGGLILAPVLWAASVAADEDRSGLRLQRQALFYEYRDLESHSHRDRIRILQAAEDCIVEAHDRREFQRCEQAEHQARQDLRETLQRRRNDLRRRRDALLEALQG